MPYGRARPPANTSEPDGVSPPSKRSTRTSPAPLSATNTSPFGATASLRGPERPLAKRFTLYPSGARGIAPSGRGTTLGGLDDGGVSKGFGRSAGLISQRTPGALACQSAKASAPCLTGGLLCPSAGAALSAVTTPAAASSLHITNLSRAHNPTLQLMQGCPETTAGGITSRRVGADGRLSPAGSEA